MSKFNPLNADYSIPGKKDFSSHLREYIERKIRLGREGIDQNIDITTGKKKGANSVIVFRNFWFDDEVFSLGCKMHREIGRPSWELWGSWMVNTNIVVNDEKVVIYSPSQFYSDYANKNLGNVLNDYFKKPIFFKVDVGLNAKL